MPSFLLRLFTFIGQGDKQPICEVGNAVPRASGYTPDHHSASSGSDELAGSMHSRWRACDRTRVHAALPLVENLDALTKLVQQHRGLFAEDGAAIACVLEARTIFTQQGVAAWDPDAEQRAMEISGAAGHPEWGRQIGADMNQGSMNFLTLGQELLWLSEVLPPLVEDDSEAYRTTATPLRGTARMFSGVLQSDPQVRAVVVSSMRQVMPKAEEHLTVMILATVKRDDSR